MKNYCKNVFIGKSLINKFKKDGGQNPIEAAKNGCKIFYGPNISNFTEIYNYLDSLQISKEVKNEADLVKYLQDKGEQVYEMDIEYSPYHDLRLHENMVLNTYLDTCDMVHFLAYDVGGA